MLEETNLETEVVVEPPKKQPKKCVVCKGKGNIIVENIVRGFYHTKEVVKETVKCPKCGE